MRASTVRTGTRQQTRLALAYGHVQGLQGGADTLRKVYGGLCHKLPVLVRTNGLCQTVAFLESKAQGEGDRAKAHGLILAHLSALLGVDRKEELANHLAGCAMTRYVADTQTVLAAWVYYKRFAESVLGVRHGDEADEGSQ